MVVPLALVFAQQPVLATIRPLLLQLINNEDQNLVVDALSSVCDETYKDQVLKLFISLIEQKGLEVNSDIWEVYYELKSPSKLAELKIKSQEPSTVRYHLPYDKVVEIRESRSTLVQGGQTGHRTWESSLVLAEHICHNIEELKGTDQVIELGAGTGLVSLALGKLEISKRIIATDGSGSVVNKLTNTITENGLNDVVSSHLLDWTDLDCVDQMPKNAVIFAGDILYGLSSTYMQIIDTVCALEPKRVFFCNPIRNEETYEEFKRLCEQKNIGVKVLNRYKAESVDESDYMFIVSVPPIPLELIELVL